MVHPQTKFYLRHSKGLLAISVRQKEGKNRIAGTLSFYIRYGYCSNKSCMFFRDLSHNSARQDPKVSGATIAAT
jgi:hypothetical protein